MYLNVLDQIDTHCYEPHTKPDLTVYLQKYTNKQPNKKQNIKRRKFQTY